MQSKGRGIISVKLAPWLGYSFYGGGVYFFKLRVCKYIEVANYPLIQIGVGWLDLAEALSFTIAEVLAACPLLILQNQIVPYANLSGEWTCPTDLKFDKASAPEIVNPEQYAALSVIPWTVPTFFESDLEYIPISSDFTDIPESKTGYWKEVLPGNGAIFMPNKEEYSLGRRLVAVRSMTYDYSSFTWWGQFIYEGCDIESPHVLLDYDVSYPVSSDPNSVYTPEDINILTCNEEYGGFPIYVEPLSGVVHIEVGAYGGAPDPEYYPPRGGIFKGSLPSFMFFPMLSLFSNFNLTVPGDKKRGPKLRG